MGLKAKLLALFAFATQAGAQARPETGFLNRSVTVGANSYRYEIYVPADYTPAKKWPVIMFLHGSGERGSDGVLQTAVGLGAAIRKSPSSFPAIVVFPQLPAESGWSANAAQMAMAALDQTLREFSTDGDRVYLTGLSLGGNGTWYLAYRYPERFAALAPVCGFVTPFWRDASGVDPVVPADAGPPLTALARKLQRVPVWMFHGEIDGAVPVVESRQAAAALKAAGADVLYTEFLGGEHNIWDNVYRSPQFTTWLFAQRRR